MRFSKLVPVVPRNSSRLEFQPESIQGKRVQVLVASMSRLEICWELPPAPPKNGWFLDPLKMCFPSKNSPGAGGGWYLLCILHLSQRLLRLGGPVFHSELGERSFAAKAGRQSRHHGPHRHAPEALKHDSGHGNWKANAAELGPAILGQGPMNCSCLDRTSPRTSHVHSYQYTASCQEFVRIRMDKNQSLETPATVPCGKPMECYSMGAVFGMKCLPWPWRSRKSKTSIA